MYIRVAEKAVSFEVSIGNAGNGVDGELTTGNKGEQFDNDDESKFFMFLLAFDLMPISMIFSSQTFGTHTTYFK